MALALDTNLVTNALAGDEHAVHEIVTRSSPYIERQLLRYPLTQEDREDLVQTTLMQVIRRLGSFRGDASFSTWLFRVTANEALMMMRSQRRLRAHLVDTGDFETAIAERQSEQDEPATRLERHQVQARIESALAALPLDYRNVVVAHYRDELGLQQIAGELRMTESAVRSRLHRARSRLRTLLAA
jgi:RNA polymerase sigma-70 factor, ECF subfamily